MTAPAFDLIPRKCEKCGKKFEASKDWAYKLPRRTRSTIPYFCSWKCLREYEKGNRHGREGVYWYHH